MNKSHRWQHQLEDDGFFIATDLVPKTMIDSLRLRTAGTLFRTSNEHREQVKSNGSLCNLGGLPEYADILAYEPILDALRLSGGSDPRWTGGYLISKPAGGPPLFWHQDWWAWSEPVSYEIRATQLFAMIYLTQTSPENGCLKVIPGSHREAHKLHGLLKAHSEELAGFHNPSDPAFADDPDEVPVAVQPGDVVFGDSRVLHGTYRNNSDEERPLIVLWYTPSYSDLPESIQAEYVDQYRREGSDIIQSNEGPTNPLLWPEPARQIVLPVLPDYDGPARPPEHDRIPDIERLSRAHKTGVR